MRSFFVVTALSMLGLHSRGHRADRWGNISRIPRRPMVYCLSKITVLEEPLHLHWQNHGCSGGWTPNVIIPATHRVWHLLHTIMV
jgi:hypothetical protein